MNIFTDLPLTALWTRFTWGIFHWFTNPRLVALTLALLVVGVLLLCPGQWRSRLYKPIAAVAVLYWLLISPPTAALAQQGLTYFLPADSGDVADAIVVLSRGGDVRGNRYETAVELWQSQRAPRIFVTGQTNIHRTLALLSQHNLPLDSLSGTTCALTTMDEAKSSAAILGLQGVRRIILITDPFHMLRSVLTFRQFGFSVTPHPVKLSKRLPSVQRTALAIREYLGLASYAALGRLKPRSPEQLSNLPTNLLRETALRGCQAEIHYR